MSDEDFKRQLDLNRDEAKKKMEELQKEFAHDMLKNDITYLFAKLKIDMELQLHRMQRDMLEQIKRLYGG
jgi:hypothetical protein